jgi:hypothetical protein
VSVRKEGLNGVCEGGEERRGCSERLREREGGRKGGEREREKGERKTGREKQEKRQGREQRASRR